MSNSCDFCSDSDTVIHEVEEAETKDQSNYLFIEEPEYLCGKCLSEHELSFNSVGRA